jgi:AraC-like DNA-binding protein
LAKIAVELEQALVDRAARGAAGQATAAILARGDGWTVADVICTSGPRDRRFEERHDGYAIAVVVAGSFQYRSALGGGLMAPGSLMLGNPGQCYECGHDHGSGDRCVAFRYEPHYFERLTAGGPFRAPRLPACRASSALVATTIAGLLGSPFVAWEELGVRLAAMAAAAEDRPGDAAPMPPNAVARVTRVVRAIERHPEAALTLPRLAAGAGLSPYHFLRTFERVTGVTPHQFILRARLRAVAVQLAHERSSVLDVALDCGFGDVSNFNRAFRAEFGVSPRAYRSGATGPRRRMGSDRIGRGAACGSASRSAVAAPHALSGAGGCPAPLHRRPAVRPAPG